MKTSVSPEFIDYWEFGTLWCLGVRVWKDRCQAIKCDPTGPATSMATIEESYELPFEFMQGTAPVPAIVFSIATHMMIHPVSDLLDVLTRKKSLESARLGAERKYTQRTASA